MSNLHYDVVIAGASRPRVLHPIMWDYYRLFEPAVLADLRTGQGAVDLHTGRVRDRTPVGASRAAAGEQ